MKLMKFREELIAIIEKGRHAKHSSDAIADEIIKKALIDSGLVVSDGLAAERPLTLDDIILLADKAIKQAEFEGGIIVLQSRRQVIMKKNNGSSLREQ